MPANIDLILADCDASELITTLERFDLKIKMHIPDSILYTDSGEYNIRNKYGSMLFHSRQLHAVLLNFTLEGGQL